VRRHRLGADDQTVSDLVLTKTFSEQVETSCSRCVRDWSFPFELAAYPFSR
jgi:uncharacterized metal-binding protein YceD (DUF177 family)